MKCHRFFDASYILHSSGVPKCECGGVIKPDVVLYEEGLDNRTMQKAIHYISHADVLIIGGTSLVVLINKGATPQDRNADLLIQKPIGQIFSQIKVKGK